MLSKFNDYVWMTVNLYFLLGMAIGFGGKALWGGQVVSLATGICFGVLLYMVIQQWQLR